MGINPPRLVAASTLLAALVAIALWLGLFDLGYGKISDKAYEFSKAIYSACLNRNLGHLEKVERVLAETDSDSLPYQERLWLEQIVRRARSGHWEYAAQYARRMMEDQVIE